MARTTGRRYGPAAALAVVVMLLGACGDAQGPAGTGEPAPTTPATQEPTSPAALEPTDPGDRAPDGYPPEVGAAVEDLAQHLTLPAEELTVVSFEDVTWSDGSLGCPEPGMSYTQALVPGTRLVLEADGVEYHYHGGDGGELVRCDRTPLQPVDDA